MAGNSDSITKPEEPKAKPLDHNNLFSLFPKFDFIKPFFNRDTKSNVIVKEGKPVTTTTTVADSNTDTEKSRVVDRVSFHNATPKISEPLAFDTGESIGRTSNPVVLWQIYALGGFLILKWVHARWRERNGNGNGNERDNDQDPNSE